MKHIPTALIQEAKQALADVQIAGASVRISFRDLKTMDEANLESRVVQALASRLVPRIVEVMHRSEAVAREEWAPPQEMASEFIGKTVVMNPQQYSALSQLVRLLDREVGDD